MPNQISEQSLSTITNKTHYLTNKRIARLLNGLQLVGVSSKAKSIALKMGFREWFYDYFFNGSDEKNFLEQIFLHLESQVRLNNELTSTNSNLTAITACVLINDLLMFQGSKTNGHFIIQQSSLSTYNYFNNPDNVKLMFNLGGRTIWQATTPTDLEIRLVSDESFINSENKLVAQASSNNVAQLSHQIYKEINSHVELIDNAENVLQKELIDFVNVHKKTILSGIKSGRVTEDILKANLTNEYTSKYIQKNLMKWEAIFVDLPDMKLSNHPTLYIKLKNFIKFLKLYCPEDYLDNIDKLKSLYYR